MNCAMRSIFSFLTALALSLSLLVPSITFAASSSASHGVVKAVDIVEEKGEGTGLGAVAGGVAGGLIGSQIGQGTGNTVATVAGIAGGAYAGHQVEKKVRSKKTYKITVKLDNGKTRVFHQSTQPAVHVGDRVKLIGGKVVKQ